MKVYEVYRDILNKSSLLPRLPLRHRRMSRELIGALEAHVEQEDAAQSRQRTTTSRKAIYQFSGGCRPPEPPRERTGERAGAPFSGAFQKSEIFEFAFWGLRALRGIPSQPAASQTTAPKICSSLVVENGALRVPHPRQECC